MIWHEIDWRDYTCDVNKQRQLIDIPVYMLCTLIAAEYFERQHICQPDMLKNLKVTSLCHHMKQK